MNPARTMRGKIRLFVTSLNETAAATSPADRWACISLLGSALTVGFSLPLARGFLVIALVSAGLDFLKTRTRPWIPMVAGLALAHLLLTVLSTAWGINPERGIGKLHKLLWFASLPAAAWIIRKPERLGVFLKALSLGIAIKALESLLTLPLNAVRHLADFPSFSLALIDQGSITDAERLMVGVVITAALLIAGYSSRRRFWWGVLAIQAIALILQFKRGSWFAAIIVLGVLAIMHLRWRSLFLLAGLLVATSMLPPVRTRLTALRTEWDETTWNSGNTRRLLMWKYIAPPLIKAHPWMGIGYRSLTPEMMKKIHKWVEPKRDHLHSNPVQVLVDTGLIGFAFYLLWMVRGLYDAASWRRRTAHAKDSKWMASALLAGLLALLVNGLVEYNFGDGEIVLMYGFIMGAAAAMGRHAARRVT
jgi:O-antigen ligase